MHAAILALSLLAAVVAAAPIRRGDCMRNLNRCAPWVDPQFAVPAGTWMCISDLPLTDDDHGVRSYQRTAWKPTADAGERLDWEAKGECPPLAEFLGIVDATGVHF